MKQAKKIVEKESSGVPAFDSAIGNFFPKKKSIKKGVRFSGTIESPNILLSVLNFPSTEAIGS